MLSRRVNHSHRDCRPAGAWNPSMAGAKGGVPQEGQRLPFQGSRNRCREVLRPASQQSIQLWGVELDIFKEGNGTSQGDGKKLPGCNPTDQWGGGRTYFKETRSPTPKERGETGEADQPDRGELIKKGMEANGPASGQAKAETNHPQGGQQSASCNRQKPGMQSKRKGVGVDIIKKDGMWTSLDIIKKERKPDGNPDGQMGGGN